MPTVNWKKAALGLCMLVASTMYADGKGYQQRQTKKTPPAPQTKWAENDIPKNGYGIFFTTDLLVWQANQNNTEFTVQNPAGGSVSVFNGPEFSPNFKYDVGFRLGMGYVMKHHDTWDTYLEYTHFDASASRSLSNSSSVFQPLLSASFAGSYTGTDASSNWSLAFNMLDADLGKQFLISKFFSCHGFLGLRTAWVQQNDSVSYSGGTLATNSHSPDLISFKNRFWGMGFLAGLDTLWGLGAGMSLYADIDTSLLCGNFNLHTRETGAGSLVKDVTDKFQSMKSITDLALGVRWDKTFSRDHYHIALQTGWEFHFLPSQWQWQAQSVFPYTNTDLLMQGWVLSGRFDF